MAAPTGNSSRPSRTSTRSDARRRRIASPRAPHTIRRLFGDSGGVGALVLAITLLLGMLLVRPVLMSLMSWHRTAGLLAERTAEVRDLEARHRHLSARLAYYRTDTFIAERARQYGLVRPGEVPFVVRELVHPELVGAYARAQLVNATQSSLEPESPQRGHAAATSRIPTATR